MIFRGSHRWRPPGLWGSSVDTNVPTLSEVQDLYDRCLYKQAYNLAIQRGPLASWRGTADRVLAGRLAFNLGAGRLGLAHHLRAWRNDREDIDAAYYYARALFATEGPLPAWRFLDARDIRLDATAIQKADLAALRGALAAAMRDFDAADMWIKLAEKLAPDHTWTLVEKSSVLEMQDRYADAIEVSARALQLRPWYRPAVQSHGHLLVLMNRDEEALAFLKEAALHIESNAIYWQLAELQGELGLNQEFHESVERLVDLTPLRDRHFEEWLLSRRCDGAYRGGNIELAKELAGKIDVPYYKLLKANLDAAGADARRVMLNVPFVRQHRVTCAPATLSAISRYWNMPADHLSVAEEICYDGTPYASERGWAERNGWAVREFTLSWDSAVALIDRGVPFTLTTHETTNSHLQAVIGYDSRKKVLLIRDPFVREVREFLAEQMLDRYKPFGPRAMAMVPVAQAQRYDGVELPDAPLWDRHTQITVALMAHDRPRGAELYQSMAAMAPDHSLTIESRFTLAAYDADVTTELECIDRLLTMFPGNRFWTLLKCSRLRRLGRPREAASLLAEVSAQKDAEPVFPLMHADSLREDARQWPLAHKLTRKALRIAREDPAAYSQHASILWDLRRFDEAMQAYRVAACLGDKNEQMAESFFIASRHFKRTDDALKFLRNRFERFGRKSPEPGKTLFWALEELGRLTEAFDALEQALKLQPDDGLLMLFAAEMHARRGHTERAAELLKQAKGRSRPNNWLRTAAALSYYWGKLAESLGYWRKVLELEPLAIDAHQAIIFRIEEVQGRAAAVEHLRQTIERFPHHLALRELEAQWLRPDDPAACEESLRKLIELHPNNAWAFRELAGMLSDLGRIDEALKLMEQARPLEPESTSFHNVMAAVLIAANRIVEARKHMRRAIELDIDNDWALRRLVGSADSLAARRAEIDFITVRLRESVTFGAALLAFQEEAANTISPDDLLTILQESLDSRPDLWHTWSVVAMQLMQMDRVPEATALLRTATERFPLMAKLWLDLAEACRLRLDREGEIAALKQAMDVRPDWLVPLRRLADACEREGELEQARELFERAVARDPSDPASHGLLAEALWKLGDQKAAIASIEKALSLRPDYGWAWGHLDDWSRQMGKPRQVQDFARDMTRRRPGDPNAWVALSNTLYEGDHFAERLAALDKALALAPRLVEAHDRRAVLLAEAYKFDEARKACQPAVFAELPLPLRGRAAWIEAKRGNLTQAIDLMRQALRHDDSYYWGWTMLAEWCRQKEDVDGLVVAATHLARLAPNDPQSLGSLADAKLRAGDRAAAKAALERAFALAPDYGYAGNTLFDMQVEDKEFSAAAETLERHRPHMKPGEHLAYRVNLAARSGARSEACLHLKQLVRTPCERWVIDGIAARAMQDAGWVEDVNRTIAEAVTDPNVNANAVAAMVAAHANDSEFRQCDAALDALDPESDAWATAAQAYLEAMGARKHAAAIRRFVTKHKARLRSRPHLWGSAGYALIQIDDARPCAQWMCDWQEREGVEPWMLTNYTQALRSINRHAEATAVHQAALSLPADNTVAEHELWLAFDLAVAGDARFAKALVTQVESGTLSPYFQALHAIIDALISIQSADDADGFGHAKRKISTLTLSFSWIRKDRPMKDSLLRAVKRIAAIRGGFGARVWQTLHWMKLIFSR